ncbi:MAG: hypothetical protein EU539_12665 [Promethearchaeota archaeon]|nr:MAG: hypothetical protein EU539_12665 [Candidatus Lokiarchaeota archaeon]
MSSDTNKPSIENYKFHHIDTAKCKECTDLACEEACFRGVYKIIDGDTNPKCIVLEDREDMCVKCHICTTVCKMRAISID